MGEILQASWEVDKDGSYEKLTPLMIFYQSALPLLSPIVLIYVHVISLLVQKFYVACKGQEDYDRRVCWKLRFFLLNPTFVQRASKCIVNVTFIFLDLNARFTVFLCIMRLENIGSYSSRPL